MLRFASSSWVGYDNGVYLCVAFTERYALDADGMSSVLVIFVHEKDQYAEAFVIPTTVRPSLFSRIAQIASRFGMRGILGATSFRDIAWISALNNRSIHPLPAKALDIGKKWFKGALKASTRAEPAMTVFSVSLPAGAVRERNGVTYEGYVGPYLKTHSFDTLSGLMDKAIRLGKETWGWAPVDLRVLCHATSNAYGLAFNPGKGEHRVSFHKSLLTEYDEMSIFRTFLHELCHHYRNERFPLSLSPHDDRFCEELGKVDPIVKENKRSCIYFSDERWQDSPVVRQQKKRATALADASRYNPEAGFFRVRIIKSGQIRLDWVPHQKGGFSRKGIPVGRGPLVDVAKGMTAEQQHNILMQPDDYRAERFLARVVAATPGSDSRIALSFWQFLQGLGSLYGQHYKELAQ